ncbi:MAG: hypothetical protein KF889_01310 [Alphaproteobacteria bacterium]|nr:hypothetical protein [Alphaproteobacteria bacterium]MCW5741540.1 hypothetical protein [Alphaproteobacteria bacterium]
MNLAAASSSSTASTAVACPTTFLSPSAQSTTTPDLVGRPSLNGLASAMTMFARGFTIQPSLTGVIGSRQDSVHFVLSVLSSTQAQSAAHLADIPSPNDEARPMRKVTFCNQLASADGR